MKSLSHKKSNIFLKNEFIKQHMNAFKSDFTFALSVWERDKESMHTLDDIDERIREIEICD